MVGGILLLLMFSLPIVMLILLASNCLGTEHPRTDRIFIWTEQLESSARRLKLHYVSDQNVASDIYRMTPEEVAVTSRRIDLDSEDPTAEPTLPFGRYEAPQYSFKKLTSLGLELWIKKMHARSESFNVDKRCNFLFTEAKEEMRRIGMTIIDAQETMTGSMYTGGIDASGYDPSPKERIIVKVRIYGTRKSDVSVVELSVFSRDKEQVSQLHEQIKQALWQ